MKLLTIYEIIKIFRLEFCALKFRALFVIWTEISKRRFQKFWIVIFGKKYTAKHKKKLFRFYRWRISCFICIAWIILIVLKIRASILKFLKNGLKITWIVYGRPRHCTILTENENWEYLTNQHFDTILREKFAQNNRVLEENTAYRLFEHLPCTEIIRRTPSSFLEITKGSLVVDSQKNLINCAHLNFDAQKIQFFGKILSDAIQEFLW